MGARPNPRLRSSSCTILDTFEGKTIFNPECDPSSAVEPRILDRGRGRWGKRGPVLLPCGPAGARPALYLVRPREPAGPRPLRPRGAHLRNQGGWRLPALGAGPGREPRFRECGDGVVVHLGANPPGSGGVWLCPFPAFAPINPRTDGRLDLDRCVRSSSWWMRGRSDAEPGERSGSRDWGLIEAGARARTEGPVKS